jgi:adenine/guanine phosphoribosyltransferase-like PRPP-binding protein
MAEAVDEKKESLRRLRAHFVGHPIFRDSQARPVAHFGLTDFVHPVSSDVIDDMADCMVNNIAPAVLSTITVVVSIADRSGGSIAHAVAVRLGVPYSLANWYPIGSPGEVLVDHCPGFSGNGLIYINGLREGMTALVVTDVMRTSQTAKNLVLACQSAGVTVAALCVGCEIVDFQGWSQVTSLCPVNAVVSVYLRGETTKEAPSRNVPIVAPSVPITYNSQAQAAAAHAAAVAAAWVPHPVNRSPRMSEIKRMPLALIEEKMERVARTFLHVSIHRNPHLAYPYSFFSLTDFVPPLHPSMLEDMADLIVYYGDFSRCDVIVSEADRGGGPLVHAVAVRTGLPYVLANWYPSGEGVGASSGASVGFSGEGRICVNGLKPEDRCIFVDDMLSSGGTAEGVIRAIVQLGAIAVEGVFVSEKLYPKPKTPCGEAQIPERKGLKRLRSLFPFFTITTIVQFVAEGQSTTEHHCRVGE